MNFQLQALEFSGAKILRFKKGYILNMNFL